MIFIFIVIRVFFNNFQFANFFDEVTTWDSVTILGVLIIFSKDFIYLLDTLFGAFCILLGCILRIIHDFIWFILLLFTFFAIGNKIDIKFLKFHFNSILFWAFIFIFYIWEKKKKNFFSSWFWVFIEPFCFLLCV